MGLIGIGTRAAKGIWSGPFNIGPLVQPITLGGAILKILEVAWKACVSLVLAGAVLLILAAVWQSVDRVLNPPFESQLVGEAHFDPASCSKEFPIVVIVRNSSKHALASAQIDVIIRQPGRTTNLNEEPSLDWDAIVQPDKMNVLCYRFPTNIIDDPKTLNYSVNLWSATRLN